jgi:hypothetical protein
MLDSRAIAYGLGFFVVLHVGYLYLERLAMNLFFAMLWLLVAASVLSGVVTGYLARRSVFASLLVLGIGVATCICLLHLVRSWLGLPNYGVDLSGVAALAVACALFIIPAVLIGGAIGSSLSPAHA